VSLHQNGVAASNKRLLSDILSVLGMVSGEPGRKCLHYKLSGFPKELGSWGHEYVRHLTGEISEVRATACLTLLPVPISRPRVACLHESMQLCPSQSGCRLFTPQLLFVPWVQEYNERVDKSDTPAVDDLLALVNDIVPFHMKHNAEAEAIDLLMETQQLKSLQTSEFVDESNFARVCLYLLRSADYVGDADDSRELLETTYEVRPGLSFP
jgi:26S proteasome regulatory subunit N1